MLAVAGYRILGQIHDGRQTVVFRAARDSDDAAVILKTTRSENPPPEQFSRWAHEFEVMCRVGAPLAYDLVMAGHRPVLVIEDVGGVSLRQRMPFGGYEVLPFLEQAVAIVDALSRVHDAQVIHKNLHPGNIIVSDAGMHLIDFTVASLLARENARSDAIEGDLVYISPEQTGRLNRALDHRTDFYSLGVIFYEMLCGSPPFSGADRMEMVHAHLARQPVPPHEARSGVPRVLSDITMKLLAKAAEERYQSCAGLKADLQACLKARRRKKSLPKMQLGASDVSQRLQVPQKLYGREREVATLLGAFERVANGSTELVLVSGYSGIGKSALVGEARRPITERHGFFIAGKFEQYHQSRPYHALLQALGELAGLLLVESERKLATWRSRLNAALGPNGRVITNLVPQWESLLGPQPPLPELTPEETQNRFHLVLGDFFRAIARPDHPLVLFIDDLQWADLPSLEVLELLATDAVLRSLLVVGAYRDNLVDATHPLMLEITRLHARQARLHEIKLPPLRLEHLSALVADTLSCAPQQATELAGFLAQRTDGNPFFVKQLLTALYEQGLVHLDVRRRAWQWNLDDIRALPLTDTAAEMMADKMQSLPPQTQHVLELAACIGHQFDLETLSYVYEHDPVTTSEHLWEALRQGLVQPVGRSDHGLRGLRLSGELESAVGDISYAFLHDQIQRAAYSLIDDAHKQQVHLTIGRLMLAHLSETERDERIFDIVSHLNVGGSLMQSPTEKAQRRQLNYQAGLKARQAAAFASALAYFETALSLLEPHSWDTDYQSALDIHREAAEAAYHSADFARLDALMAEVLAHARTVLDKVSIYDAKQRALVAEGKLREAVQTGFAVLELLDVHFPASPGPAEIGAELAALATLVPADGIEALARLPRMTEAGPLAAMRMLSAVFSSVYLSSPHLLPFVVSRQIQLSVKYGNAPSSAYAYAAYGLMLCGAVGDIEAGYRFGTLALELCESFADAREKARVWHIVYTFTRPWKEHTRNTLRPLLETWQSGLHTGDFEYASYAALLHCYYSYFVGRPLHQLDEELAAFGQAMTRIGQDINFRYLSVWHQAVHNLLGRGAEVTRLQGERCDETTLLAQYETSKDRTGLFFIYYNKMVLEYMFGRHDEAAATAQAVEQHIDAVVGVMCVAIFHFIDSLIGLARWATAPASRPEILQRVESNQQKLRHWAKHAPMNYQHKFDLVAAELARVNGRDGEAMRLYEQAIAGAAAWQYLQEEALACELAARFYAGAGLDRVARQYATLAHSCYERWGAHAKVAELELHFGPPTMAGETVAASQQTLDVESLLKASEAISREIVFSALVDRLVSVAMENAGAARGVLVVQEDGRLDIMALRDLDRSDKVGFALPCALDGAFDNKGLPLVPAGLIQYVSRTRESIVLDSAQARARFANDAYLQAWQPRSALCLPLLHQGQPVAILYLENKLTQDAFTPQRLELLRMLRGQAAISITNARLYHNLQQAGDELKRKEEQLAQFLEAVPVGIFVTNAQGQPLYTNSKAEEILGQGVAGDASSDELSSIYHAYLAGTNDMYPTEKLPVVQALRGTSVSSDDMEIELPDGRRRLGVTASPIAGPDGRVQYAIAAFEDITERKQAQKLLEDYSRTLEEQVRERTRAAENAQQMAESANRMKSRFLANMSHEVRTPLNAIVGLTDLALRADPSPKIGDYLRKLRAYSRSLLGIINDILDFSRIEAGKMSLETVDFDLREVIESLDGHVGDEVQRKGLELLVSLGTDVPTMLRGDALRLNQVLSNLVYNAVKFTQRGWVLVRVRLEEDGPRPRIAFSVTDTGIGIEPQQQQRIFESFEQIDGSTSRQYGGAGLGLAICKHLVERMGGELKLDSEPGRGSTFSFVLPLEQQVDKMPRLPQVAENYRNARVLVVDDNPLAGEILADMLTALELRPTTVTSGEAALAALDDAEPYDLIMLDWKMPGMDGIETARRIASKGSSGPAPRLILATAYDQSVVRPLADDVGIKRILVKPVSQSALFDAVMEAFGQRAERRSQERQRENDRPLDGMRILLVEDVEINQEIAREILELAGANVQVASDGREAIRAVHEGAFDVVLMDVQMPGMDGLEATRIIRGETRFNALPIIAMTAHAMKGDREQCLEAGMNDHITKPINTAVLVSTLLSHARPGAAAISPGLAAKSPGALPSEPARSLGPALDVKDALAQFGGNMATLRRLLDSFVVDYAGVVQSLRLDLARGDEAAARRTLHKLVGASGNLRLRQVYATAIKLQHSVHNGDAERVPGQLDLLATALREATQRIQQLPATDGSPPTALERPPEPTTPTVKGRVMVVDDDDATRAFVRYGLENCGHSVVEAASGNEALTLVSSEAIDTILLDVVMPGLDGFRTCQTLKGREDTAHIPVLLVTALEDRSDRLLGIRCGADDFIHKPLDVGEVTLRVGNAVRTKKLYDELQANYRRLQHLEGLTLDGGRPDVAIVDRDVLLARLGGTGAVRVVREILLGDKHARVAALRAAIEARTAAPALRELQVVRGSLLGLAARRAVEALHEVEQRINAGHWAQADEQTRSLERELSRLEATLERLVDEPVRP